MPHCSQPFLEKPIERIMSILNIGLQCVGVMRSKGSEQFELSIGNSNSIKELRNNCFPFKDEVAKSLKPTVDLLNAIIKRLKLKGEDLDVFDAATESEIESFWEILLQIDSSLTITDTTQKAIKDKIDLKQFLKHCCVSSHYSFQIKKCQTIECAICKPIKISPEIFSTIHYLPNPVPGADDHYKGFEEVYGESPTDKHRPSIQSKQRRSIAFSPSQQHVKNVGPLVQCEECEKWRLLFCKHKFKPDELSKLKKTLEEVSYSCGATSMI